jgi:diaminopimelate decarboxylase
MDYFNYKRNTLYAEDVDINTLAEKYGTPLYVYSKRTFLEHYRKVKSAFSDMDLLICYSVKANSSGAILREMKNEGAGFDIVSGGELFRSLRTGVDPKKIVYAGVGKTAEEIRYALKSGILMFNIESTEELKAINEIAKSMKKKADIAFRINPDVDALTHHYVNTGKKESKFGIDINLALGIYKSAKKLKHINVIGVDMHIGSQITTPIPYINAVSKIAQFVNELNKEGIRIEYLNIGGGLGIIYNEEKPTTADVFAKAIKPHIAGFGIKVILEPGRFIIGNAGVLITRVTYNKKGRTKNFLITDAGMNDLIRPALYTSYHKIIPVNVKKDVKLQVCDVVGPICESADFLGKDRHLPDMKSGELLCVRSAGAYGMAMASNYNSRPRAAEVMVDGSRHTLIRQRETYEDLIEKENKA